MDAVEGGLAIFSVGWVAPDQSGRDERSRPRHWSPLARACAGTADSDSAVSWTPLACRHFSRFSACWLARRRSPAASPSPFRRAAALGAGSRLCDSSAQWTSRTSIAVRWPSPPPAPALLARPASTVPKRQYLSDLVQFLRNFAEIPAKSNRIVNFDKNRNCLSPNFEQRR